MPLDLARQLVIRWPDPQPAHLDLLKQIGVEAIILDKPDAAFSEAARSAGIETALPDVLKDTVKTGLWPGVRTPAKRTDWVDEVASASAEPWVDANGWAVAYERALHPNRPAILSYLPDKDSGLTPDRYVAFETLEMALLEARMGGGNYILAMEPRYREALLNKDAKALAAWASLGKAAAWLKANRKFFGLPTFPTITMMVEEGDTTSEMALLAYRRSAAPNFVTAATLPAPNPQRILALMAAGISKRDAALERRILAHAEAGSFVAIDWKPAGSPEAKWKVIKKQEDRTIYQLGKGQIVIYNDAVTDPSEYALDVIDLITYRRRPARIWNALAAIPLSTLGPAPGDAVYRAINYGQPTRDEVQARLLGNYKSATLLTPEKEPQPLKTYRRGDLTEVFIPRFTRAVLVHFRQA